jgi:hypothetical protein
VEHGDTCTGRDRRQTAAGRIPRGGRKV